MTTDDYLFIVIVCNSDALLLDAEIRANRPCIATHIGLGIERLTSNLRYETKVWGFKCISVENTTGSINYRLLTVFWVFLGFWLLP